MICIFVIFLIVISNLAIYNNIGTSYNSNWDVEVVDSSNQFSGYRCQIGINSNGNPIIEYQATSDILLAHRNVNHDWQSERIANNSDGYSLSSMVIDNVGIAHLIYLTQNGRQLVYTTKIGGIWESQKSEDAIYGPASLAVDNNGNPHVVYFRYGVLNYTHWDNGSWTTITIDNSSTVKYNNIEIDNSNFPHILASDVSREKLKYFYYNGFNWSEEDIDCGSGVLISPSSPDLRIDSNGSPHIVYVDEQNMSLKYVEKTGNGWSVETVDSHGVISWPGIAIDKNDVIHIAYHSNGLKYAKKVEKIWSTETIDSSERTGTSPSIVVDKTGNVHIAYFTKSPPQINYATTKKSGSFRTYPISKNDYAMFITVSASIVIISLVSSYILLTRRNKKTKDRKGPAREKPASLQK